MEEEKLKRRPPFKNYINVKHTGTSPFRKHLPPALIKARQLPIVQAVERRQQPPRAVKQTNSTATNVRNEKKPGVIPSTSNGLTTKTVAQKKINPSQTKNVDIPRKIVEKLLDPKVNVPVRKPVLRSTRLNNKNTNDKTKQEHIENKSVSNELTKTKPGNKVTKTKSAQRQGKGSRENDKENIPVTQEILPKQVDIVNNQKENDEQRSGRNTNKNGSVPAAYVEPENGPIFQRLRLDEETSRLQELMAKWMEQKDTQQHLPAGVLDEILSVIGQTSLLISSKFKQFKTLVDDCAEQLTRPNQPQMVTPDDLDGFWEMMYIQIDQLHNKYSKLEKLAKNTWVDPDDIQKRKPNKLLNKTVVIKKKGQSRFQDFLKKNGLQKDGIQKENKLSIGNGLNEDTVLEDHHSTSIESINLESFKCCTTPKAVKNLLTARRSRRSSMNIIMSMSGLGKFDVTGNVLPSPKKERSVRFLNDESSG